MVFKINRLNPIIALFIITSIRIAAILGAIPEFQKEAYAKTAAIEYDKYDCEAGYPAGEGFTSIKSVDEIDELGYFTITLDVKDLEPTHTYCEFINNRYLTKEKSFLYKDDDLGTGQYYIAKLESGEKIIVLLDYTVLNIPKEGKITLPVGKRVGVEKDEFFEKFQREGNLKEENSDWFVNMAEEWRKGKESDDADTKKCVMEVLLIVAFVILQYFLFVCMMRLWDDSKKEKDSSILNEGE